MRKILKRQCFRGCGNPHPAEIELRGLSNNYTMGCPPVLGDNPRALATVDYLTRGITILYHLHQCRSCTSRGISC